MVEIELKFLLREAASKVWSRLRAAEVAFEKPRTRLLRSIYWDTPEHVLAKKNVALRVRRDGRRWIQTVKTKQELSSGLSQAGEIESPASGGRLSVETIPDEAVRNDLLKWINGAPLQPVCETIIRRAATLVSLPDGTRAELAVDIGQIVAGQLSAELREVEIELIDGSPAGLFAIARTIFPEGGVAFSRLSKSGRGYLLAEQGIIEQPLAPRKAAKIELPKEHIAEHSAQLLLRECLDQIATNIRVVLQLDDPEGPHQLRIGLRRLRSAFGLFIDVMQSPEMQRLGDEARWLGQEVGRLRDIDVVAIDIAQREADGHPDETDLTHLAADLKSKAQDRRRELLPILSGPRVQGFVFDLAQFVETRGWLMAQDMDQTGRLAAPVVDVAERALKKRWKKVRKNARDIAALDIEQRHELRKELKKLRYAVEFFSSLYPQKRLTPFLKHLKELQEIFGELNDAATVRDMMADPDIGDATGAKYPRAVGWMLGTSALRAELGWATAKARWRDLRDTRLFWE